MNRYDYEELKEKVLSAEATQEDIRACSHKKSIKNHSQHDDR